MYNDDVMNSTVGPVGRDNPNRQSRNIMINVQKHSLDSPSFKALK
jgi:hypothetical protein